MLKRDKAHRLRALIVQAAASLPDEEALDGVELFEAYDKLVEKRETVKLGFRFRHGGKLWRIEQPTHTFDGIYEPGTPGTEALYSEVTLPGDGTTPDRPIAYNNNMALESGKYYAQNDVVYRCTRDTINPVYADLSALVGMYVEVYTP